MTPAEKLAATKPSCPKAPRRPRKAYWVCLVRDRRQALGLTLKDVQDGTGIHYSTISLIERGFDATLAHARAVAEFFGATVDELWPDRRD